MDDIFDSLIYILITLAALAISFMGKKKKPAERPSFNQDTEDHSESERAPFFSEIDRLLDPEFGDDEFETEQVNAYHDDEEKIIDRKNIRNQTNNEILDSTPSVMSENKEKMPYNIEHADTSEVFSHSITDEDLTKNEESKSIADDFDLEKAIVYSEILNRKEY